MVRLGPRYREVTSFRDRGRGMVSFGVFDYRLQPGELVLWQSPPYTYPRLPMQQRLLYAVGILALPALLALIAWWCVGVPICAGFFLIFGGIIALGFTGAMLYHLGTAETEAYKPMRLEGGPGQGCDQVVVTNQRFALVFHESSGRWFRHREAVLAPNELMQVQRRGELVELWVAGETIPWAFSPARPARIGWGAPDLETLCLSASDMADFAGALQRLITLHGGAPADADDGRWTLPGRPV